MANGRIYFAEQQAASSVIKSVSLSGGSSRFIEVSSSSNEIQSISIDWDSNRVYYSINADFGTTGSHGIIGYVDLDLTSNTVIFTISGNTPSEFYPFDIGVYDGYVYALENRNSIIRVSKTLTGSTTATSNTKSTVVDGVETFARPAVDLQFVKCIDYPTVSFEKTQYNYWEYENPANVVLTRDGDLRCCSVVNLQTTEDTRQRTPKISL